jgi:hypothetical protein
VLPFFLVPIWDFLDALKVLSHGVRDAILRVDFGARRRFLGLARELLSGEVGRDCCNLS